MPELPEVETARRGIEPHLLGQTFSHAVIRNHSLRWPVPNNLSAMIAGQQVLSVNRRAKYILIRIGQMEENRAEKSIAGDVLIHLGMTGNLRVLPASTPAQKHDHVDIHLGNEHILRYTDPRRFGTIQWVDYSASGVDPSLFDTPADAACHRLLANLGPEPLTDDFAGDRLYQMSRGRSVAVKNFIMNNAVVVGVGNIYASESLFAAGIHPTRAAGKISKVRYQKLADEIKQVLAKAIEAGGTTLRDFLKADGQPGYFRIQLNVYDRADEPCVVCGKPLQAKMIGQRNSFFCNTCQT